MNIEQKLILGQIINPISDKKTEYFPNGAMLLKKNKKGIFLISKIGERKKVEAKIKGEFELCDYSNHVIIPTFFDMHFHWVQDDVRTMPKDNLLQWLENYTFPAEAKFKNKKYAKQKAKKFFKRLVSTGTLGGACYSSIHEHALDYAMEEVVGDFVIGNVLMTMNSPKKLLQEPKDAVSLVNKLAKKYKSKYCLTPRFAIATDPITMKKTSKIAKSHKCFMQSHLSETQNEINYVTSMYKQIKGFEKVKTYTDIYKKVGMLGPRTIMGHGIHLKKSELEIISKTKTTVAHCPTSNAPIKDLGLGSGLFDFKKVERSNIRWALGSDIGGGPFLSMFDVMKSFVEQNKRAKKQGATYKKALYRATLAGAEILKVDKTKGNLCEKKEANFIVIKPCKGQKNKNIEKIFGNILKVPKNRRSEFDNFTQCVYYQGYKVFTRK